ncbi:MAG: RidA family protein [Alicyclobacillus herbarius]|uniref:RidA family protein n=1 Tax=Alicyclobacillus herbarius TaxID=122960 RepID=UPI002354011E|nr:RidA family protein [Alicyclobacillus herbarius]MCL6633169.1 RidA family protein [Alicyclobacillus herbarius]
MRTISTEKAPAAIGPYAQAVEVGGFVYTSGQIPLRPDGTLVEGGAEEQVKQVLANLDAVLTAAGVRRTDVAKATIFLTDLADFDTVNAAYGAFFGDHRPARSCIQVAALPKGAKVEIELVAVKAGS